MARIIMLQKRNTNWLSRKIEAQRERSGIRGKGLGVGFRGKGFGVPPTIWLGWLQGYPLTIIPALLFNANFRWKCYNNLKLSGSSKTKQGGLPYKTGVSNQVSLLTSSHGPKAVHPLVSPLLVDCLSTFIYQPSQNPKTEYFLCYPCYNAHKDPCVRECSLERGHCMHTSRSCTSFEKHTLWVSF